MIVGSNIIYEDETIYIEVEKSEIPWLKIFTKENYYELSDVPKELRLKLWELYDILELEMIQYYNPKKINMASFANMLPRVHIHIMARFENDSYFPEPMWGVKQRESNLSLPSSEKFYENIFDALTQRESHG